MLVADLHEDFTGTGPMVAPGAASTARALADLLRDLERDLRTDSGTGAGDPVQFAVAVEGRQWGQRVPFPPDFPFPPHCLGFAHGELAEGLTVPPAKLHVWERCPAGGGDVLAAVADGRGQLFSLEVALSDPPARVDVAGLSAEHSAFALAEAVARRFGPLGTTTAFWPELSTFLRPDQADARLRRLEATGVVIEPGAGITLR